MFRGMRCFGMKRWNTFLISEHHGHQLFCSLIYVFIDVIRQKHVQSSARKTTFLMNSMQILYKKYTIVSWKRFCLL